MVPKAISLEGAALCPLAGLGTLRAAGRPGQGGLCVPGAAERERGEGGERDEGGTREGTSGRAREERGRDGRKRERGKRGGEREGGSPGRSQGRSPGRMGPVLPQALPAGSGAQEPPAPASQRILT